ncbi:28S ribosomal protein S22, mitochondrial [Schistocerca serialis cubense]|uniref:28S ribosomal protein S22, mitochondrial n=1 Tax=Schistocerca serialis cubense TaxID=2023355 RepID=UPI00214ECB99|nr:28S ribosomal protein S22, mitochondrial [Schistocerca serialis cubense]
MAGNFRLLFKSFTYRLLQANLRESHFCRLSIARRFSAEARTDADRDPAPFFFNKDVQNLLKKLTRVDLHKVFRARKEGKDLKEPEYKFMSTEEVNKAVEEAWQRAEERLQMPPFLLPTPDVRREICKDPELQGYCDSKFLFTDITFGVCNEDRLIVARDPDGALRHADRDERFRCSQIYFPLPGRKLRTPHMFEEEHLKPLLDTGEYEFILDRACVQFDPDSPDFCRVRDQTFDHVEKSRHFSKLRSTRHFGPLAFYLAWHRNIDSLLLDIVSDGRLDEATALINLFHKLNPSSESAIAAAEYEGDDLGLIRLYISSSDCRRRGQLELAIQTLLELQKQQELVAEGIQHAHGTGS